MKSRILVVIAVLAALLATTPSVGAQEAPNQDPATPAADEATEFEAQLLDDTGFSVAEWIPAWEVTRLSLGFATPSRQWLTRLVGRDQGQTTYEAYGVPLSNDEEREMKIRARLDEELPQVRKEAAEIIGFAGTFMELAPTGKTRIVIRTTETVRGRDQRAIRDLTTLGSRVKFDGNAEHSLDTLEAAFEDIAEVAMGDDSPIHGVRVDIPNNQVVVAVEPNGPADVDLPISVAGIVFIETTPLDEVSGCSTRFLCGEPVRGGLEADNLAPGRSRCTSGFMVRTNEGQRAMLWAAHCGEDGDEVKIGNRLGPTGERFTQFSQSGTVDAALVSINDRLGSSFELVGGDLFSVASIPFGGLLCSSVAIGSFAVMADKDWLAL